MIELNGVKVTVDDLVTMYNIPIDKLRKAPVFEINPIYKVPDKLNGGFKVPVGNSFDAVFFGRNRKTGHTDELRFVLSKTASRVGDKLIDVYDPKKVVFRGDAVLKTDIEEAIYFWLHPKNKTSPFRSPKTTKPWRYIFVDNEAVANQVIESIRILTEALNHAGSLSGRTKVIMAKGLNIQSVENMEPYQLTAALLNKAKENPALYMEKVAKNDTLFDGMIQDAIDKNMFISKDTSGLKSWFWNAGPNNGEKIVDVTGGVQDPAVVLFNFIRENIERFYTPITNLSLSISSQEKASTFLSDKVIDLDGGGASEEYYKHVAGNHSEAILEEEPDNIGSDIKDDLDDEFPENVKIDFKDDDLPETTQPGSQDDDIPEELRNAQAKSRRR